MEGGQSPYTVQFEILHGLTKTAAEAYEKARSTTLQRLTASNAELSTLLNEDGFLGGYTLRRLIEMLLPREATRGNEVRQPVWLATVQLVANNGRTLFLSSSASATSSATGATSPLSSLRSVNVSAATGERVFVGDVVLVRPAASSHSERQGTVNVDDENEDDHTQRSEATVQFVTTNAAVFTDPADWKEAVGSNLMAVMRWMAKLLAQPPGLAQLSFLLRAELGERAAAGDVKGEEDDEEDEPEVDVMDGWARSLQLPLLLHTSKDLADTLDFRMKEKLRRVTLSVLRAYADLFAHAEAIMPLPALFHHLLCEWVASPLFVDGFSQTLVHSATSIGSTAWQASTAALSDTLPLVLQAICLRREHRRHAVSLSASAEQLERHAVHSVELVLFRLSGVWLTQSRLQAQQQRHPERSVVINPDDVAVQEALEEMARGGVFQRIVQWLQERETRRNQADATSSAVEETELDRLCRPPTLPEIRELHGLGEGTASDHLEAMRRTYNPYLGKEAVRFLEAGALAAYAELYGDPARAVRAVVSAVEDAKGGHRVAVADAIGSRQVRAVRVVGATQQGLRSGGLAPYSLTEVRHHAMFGLPVLLAVRAETRASQAVPLSRWLPPASATSAAAAAGTTAPSSPPPLNDSESSDDTTSENVAAHVGFVLVRLQGRFALFPVVWSVASDPQQQVTVYVLKDADLLTDFVATSGAAEESGVADAWLITGTRGGGGGGGGERSGNARRGGASSSPSPGLSRLLPCGTPALTYMDLIRRLVAVRHTLQREANMQGGTAGNSGGERPGSPGPAPSPGSSPLAASTLWMQFFARGALPCQAHLHAVSSPASSVLTGVGAGKVAGQDILNELVEACPFTAPQVEVLHALTSAPAATAGAAAAGGGGGGGVLSGLRVLEGTVGSGKTTMLYAAGVARGKLHTAARREHHGSIQPILSQFNEAVQQLCGAVAAASSVDELFGDSAREDEEEDEEDGEDANGGRRKRAKRTGSDNDDDDEVVEVDSDSSRSEAGGDSSDDDDDEVIVIDGDEGANKKRKRRRRRHVMLRDLPEELASAAAERTGEYVRLNEGLRYCTTPLLLRPDAHRSVMPPTVSDFLFDSNADTDEESTPHRTLNPSSVVSLARMLAACHERTLQAPLSHIVSEYTQYVKAVGDLCATIAQEADGSPVLYTGLLPLLLHARDVRDTESAVAASQKPDWAAYLTEALWASAPSTSVRTDLPPLPPTTASDAGDWSALPSAAADEDTFEPVTMPETVHLSTMAPDQARGWLAVFAEKQVALLPHLRQWLHDTVLDLFRFFCDTVNGVAAVSHVLRQTLVSTTGRELLQQQCLPFLWTWGPTHVLLDDADHLRDGLFSVLPPANNVVLSVSAETPILMERQRFACTVLLQALRKELQRSVALTTAALREPQRCQRNEINAALSQLCHPVVEPTDGGAGSPNSTTTPPPPTTAANGVRAGYEKDDGGDNARPAFAGLVSFSALEAWSHAIPRTLGLVGDGTTAAFLCDYLHRYAPQLDLCLFGAFAEEVDRLREQVAQGKPPTTPTRCRVCCVPFIEDSGDAVGDEMDDDDDDADRECEVAVICLSGFVQRYAAGAAGSDTPQAAEERHRVWGDVMGRQDGLFVHRLQLWLWRVLSRVRHGAFLIGSKEVFTHVPPVRALEAHIATQRETLSPQPFLSYWLPRGTQSCVLALSCPDHYKCKRTATVVYSESNSTCEVVCKGAVTCPALCLKTYDHCPKNAHACLVECHVRCDEVATTAAPSLPSSSPPDVVDEEAAESAEPVSPHAHCPYPCCARLPCGHICDRACGDPCEPCSFVGLRELTCGQRVVSGMSGGDKTVQYEVFPHFQEARCGAPVRRCPIPVTVPCPRCGTKTKLPCYQYTLALAQQTHRAREDGESASNVKGAASGGAGVVVLPELQCAGCVGLFNKVAKKYGYDLLPVPPAERAAPPKAEGAEARGGEGSEGEANEDDDDDDADLLSEEAGGPLPRHLLSADAQGELRRELALAGKKAELLVMKEALEISSGQGTATSDYAVCKAEYEANKATQADQDQQRIHHVRAEVGKWTQRLRKELEKQTAAMAEMETVMPLLLSEAENEAERQRTMAL